MPYEGNFDSNISCPIVSNALDKSIKSIILHNLHSFGCRPVIMLRQARWICSCDNHTDNLLEDGIFRDGLVIDCAQLANIFDNIGNIDIWR